MQKGTRKQPYQHDRPESPRRQHIPAPSVLYQFHIAEDAVHALELLPQCLHEVNPLNQRQFSLLPRSIRDLWKALTMERALRKADYIANPAFFSAYLRYFMPWNLVRLTALLTDLSLDIPVHGTVLDIGSGPLTFPLALYIARPELRTKPLRILCVDRAPRIMETGKLLLETLAARHAGSLPPWNIELHQGRFGEPLKVRADLVSAVNVLNEFVWKHADHAPLADHADSVLHELVELTSYGGHILVVEPGEPRAGGLISALRANALLADMHIEAPCPHTGACPMPGIFRTGQRIMMESAGIDAKRPSDIEKAGPPATREVPHGSEMKPLAPVRMPTIRPKYPWCHFAVPAELAPSWLRKLSESAGLGKEKLSFSFILMRMSERTTDSRAHKAQQDRHAEGAREKTVLQHHSSAVPCRMVSDAFPLPGHRLGRYACSPLGYTLISTSQHASLPASGDLVLVPVSSHTQNVMRAGQQLAVSRAKPPASRPGVAPEGNIDSKSGAVHLTWEP